MSIKLNFKTGESLELHSSESIPIESIESFKDYTYITFKVLVDMDMSKAASNWLNMKFITDVVVLKDKFVIKIANRLLVNTLITY